MAAAVEEHEETESIFTSVADLLVGFLFVFLILLTYFALQYQSAAATLLDDSTGHASILPLADERFPVEVQPEIAVLSLPESFSFDDGGAELSERGRLLSGSIAHSLRDVLRCQLGLATDCGTKWAAVEAVIIDGHVDESETAQMASRDEEWALSISRAFSVYRAMIAAEPALARAKSIGSVSRPLFRISGLGSNQNYRDQPNPNLYELPRVDGQIGIRLVMKKPGTG